MLDLITTVKEITPLWVKVPAVFMLAFVITAVTIPSIVRVARLKDLCAKPNMRTSHDSAIPNLGGMALFIGFLISTILIAGDHLTSNLFYFIGGLIILFFVGMKDDVLIIDPKKKLAAQIIVAFIVAIFANIKIVNLFDMFHIGYISDVYSIAITVFMILFLTNGFNLIDGIDGLASGTGIITSIFFGIFFWNSRDVAFTIICFSLAGSLSGFFLYNVFGKQNKIFLGDTGSLILGLTVSVLMIQFLDPGVKKDFNLFPQASPAIAAGVLILPLFDTMRVFTLRIIQGHSPFVADHQHIHHLLLGMGYSHLRSTLILLGVNLFFIMFCIILGMLGNVLLILLTFALATVMSFVLVQMKKRHSLKIAAQELDEQKLSTEGDKDTVPEPEEAEYVDV